MAASKLGVQTPGVENARWIEGPFQSLVNSHQNIAHRCEHAAGFVGAPDQRGMSARVCRGCAHR
jgi:hypothetical protein